MIRGTTPTFKLTVNDESVNFTEAANVYATFKQDNGNSLTKQGSDVDIQEKEVDVYLTQEETLKFLEGPLHIQLNWTYPNGRRACSKIKTICVGKNLIGNVLE